MDIRPTGRIESGGCLVLERTLRGSVEHVWASVVDPARLARWYGTWAGDPATGRVEVVMTAEGQTEAEPVRIRRCVPPRHLAVTLGEGTGDWRIDVDLVATGEATTLRLSHHGLEPGPLESIGPGWEYYLDRLVAAETGADPDAVDFGRDYHPAMAEHYRILGGQFRTGR